MCYVGPMKEPVPSSRAPAPKASSDVPANLAPLERAAVALTRFANETPGVKRLQTRWLRTVTQFWVSRAISRRTLVDNVDPLLDFAPDRGVVLVANHRSFFDMYMIMLGLYGSGAEWPERLYFPVRSNFFYEHPAGLAVNFAVGGGSMYPPIFRDRAKAEHNKDSLARTVRFLEQPGTVVGLHPEGTRNKRDDPYELLPAQPGIGQIILASKPIVVPIFINGLSNDVVRDVKLNFHPQGFRQSPIIICYGDPLDYSDLAARRPRAALYKQMSDRTREAITELGARERELRAQCTGGQIPADDPNWISRRIAALER
jgi:1-acyl-sn-glycerol-3-phosphate acyltransferase